MMEIKMPPIMGKAPNIVGTIAVEKDQFVSEGQVLANVETGKGNRPIKVGSSGRIAEILCQEGQEVKVKVIGIDENGRINLSIKKAMDPPPRPAGQGRPMGRPGGHNGGGFRGKPAPAEPASFEDRLKQFMAASDSKLSELRQSERRSSRRGGRK